MRIGRIKVTLFHGERPVLEHRHYRKHQRMFATLKNLVTDGYGSEVSLDFYNAVMMMVDRVVDGIRGSEQFVNDWRAVFNMMETVYLHMDGWCDHEQYVLDGSVMKDRIERVLEAA
jgi:hypothetical protein